MKLKNLFLPLIFVLFIGSANSQEVFNASDFQDQYDSGKYTEVLSLIEGTKYALSFDLLKMKGDVYQKLETYGSAIDSYTNALLFQEDPHLLVSRASAYLEFGEPELCLSDLIKARESIPNDAELNYVLGNHSQDIGDLSGAVLCYKKAIKSDPNEGKYKFMLASVYNGKGNFKKSIRYFEEVTEEYPQAKYNIALSYLQDKNYNEAVRAFNALEIDQAMNKDLFFLRAEAKYKLDDKKGACSDYKEASDLGDYEALGIYKDYCLRKSKKSKSSRINTGIMYF